MNPLTLVLHFLKDKTYQDGHKWLEKILETGEGNYIGFIVLSKQDFEEENTGFKKMFASWDDRKETNSTMTQDEKSLINKVNRKKDNME